MSQSDQAAAAAVVRHHEELANALIQHVTKLCEAAEIGSLRLTWQVRDALVGWLHAELLPHAYAEEEALYPVAARQPGGALLVEGMLAEHRVIAELATELETTPSPVAAAAAGRALRAVFETHLGKENELIVPLLVDADGVDLAALLAGMHQLLGEQSEPAAGGCGCGDCGCGTPAALPGTGERHLSTPLFITPAG
jgi:iron-sulfur cluster repair protein YtfE (RIC family)